MDRVAFRELLIRYTNGSATAAEKSMLDHWYELLYDNKLPALQQTELDNIEQEMWVFIEKEGNLSEPDEVYRSKRMKRLIYFIGFR